MKLEYGITVFPEISGPTNVLITKAINVIVYGRTGKNAQVKLNGGIYQTLVTSGEGLGLLFQNLTAGSPYIIYYKDDDVPETRLATATIPTYASACYVDSRELYTLSTTLRNDILTVKLDDWDAFGIKKSIQLSVDGGSTFSTFETSGVGYTPKQIPLNNNASFDSILTRRPDLAGCTTSWLTNLRVIEIFVPTNLKWLSPEVTKTNETTVDGNDGTIRLNSDPNTTDGVPEWRLLNADGTEFRTWQVTTNQFFLIPPGVYIGEVRDDFSTLQTTNQISVLAANDNPDQAAGSRSSSYINNNANFTRWFYTFGLTIDDFQSYYPLGGGSVEEIPVPPIEEVIDVPTEIPGNVRVTSTGDTRVTSTGDRRVVTV